MGLRTWVAERLFRGEIQQQVRLAVRALDDVRDRSLYAQMQERDRYDADRHEMLRLALEAWRVNPLARRIVELTSQYVVGGGVTVTCKHAGTDRFLKAFWDHPLNRMTTRCYEWCDELTRTGNLFVLLSSDAAGMSYVRAVPATEIERIESRPNDIEQAVWFYPKGTVDDPDPRPWPAAGVDDGNGTVMLHYAINRPVGAQWGESDLSPVLKWLSRYANWLEDRARLNRFRTAFLYVVRGRYTSEAERLARQAELNGNPPSPGSILVTDETESWEVIAPKLEADQAGEDGLALKKMVAAGSGIPMHFLAEPEGSTRTTAEAAGGPTYRRFEQRQEFFLWLLQDLLQQVVARRARVDRRVSRTAEFGVSGTDISARDNMSMALAASNVYNVFVELLGRGLIDQAELLRIVYRFAGEAVDVEEMLAKARAASRSTEDKDSQDEGNRETSPGGRASGTDTVDPETGEPKQ